MTNDTIATLERHRFLLSERTALQRILAGIPCDDVITRGSFQARLEEVEFEIRASAVKIQDESTASRSPLSAEADKNPLLLNAADLAANARQPSDS